MILVSPGIIGQVAWLILIDSAPCMVLISTLQAYVADIYEIDALKAAGMLLAILQRLSSQTTRAG
jgi:hypothetical protein